MSTGHLYFQLLKWRTICARDLEETAARLAPAASPPAYCERRETDLVDAHDSIIEWSQHQTWSEK